MQGDMGSRTNICTCNFEYNAYNMYITKSLSQNFINDGNPTQLLFSYSTQKYVKLSCQLVYFIHFSFDLLIEMHEACPCITLSEYK